MNASNLEKLYAIKWWFVASRLRAECGAYFLYLLLDIPRIVTPMELVITVVDCEARASQGDANNEW
jgi:hypothetical protein